MAPLLDEFMPVVTDKLEFEKRYSKILITFPQSQTKKIPTRVKSQSICYGIVH